MILERHQVAGHQTHPGLKRRHDGLLKASGQALRRLDGGGVEHLVGLARSRAVIDEKLPVGDGVIVNLHVERAELFPLQAGGVETANDLPVIELDRQRGKGAPVAPARGRGVGNERWARHRLYWPAPELPSTRFKPPVPVSPPGPVSRLTPRRRRRMASRSRIWIAFCC